MGGFQSVGIIGVGNMGEAIVRGVTSGRTGLTSVHVFDVDSEQLNRVSNEHGAEAHESMDDLVRTVDFLILAVKPSVVPDVLSSINADAVSVASIAAGVDIDTLKTNLTPDSHVIRIMPNTPAQIGEGMSFLAPGPDANDDFVEATKNVFDSIGKSFVVDEKKMDAVTALSGSGPAYVFYFLEALTEAGVYMGLDADEAQAAAEQTVFGAAKLARERNDAGPNQLRSEVSSPGGTTVEAIKHLDESGVKGIFEEAINKAREKSERLG